MVKPEDKRGSLLHTEVIKGSLSKACVCGFSRGTDSWSLNCTLTSFAAPHSILRKERCVFPECVAKGSSFLGRGSGGGGLFVARFVFSSLIIGDAVPISSVTKGDVIEVVKVNFAWKAWAFVALRRVWSVKCEVCSGGCEAWGVTCAVWRVERTVKCGVWSVKWGVWSVKCGMWSVEVWSEECEVWR